MNLYIMRHGETDWNTVRRIQGTTDIPLNDAGIKMTEESSANIYREGIVFDRIYTSPLQRAVKTAELMNAYSNAQIIPDSRITEFNFGEGEGKVLSEMQKDSKYENIVYWFTDPGKYKAQLGAESFEHFFSRLNDFIKKEILPLENKCKNVLITCHGGTTRGLLCTLENRSSSTLNKIKIPNCGLNLVVLEKGKFRTEYTARKFYTDSENSLASSYEITK